MSNNLPLDTIIIYLAVAGVAILLSAAITRAVFSIPKFLRYQKAQLKLAALMARDAGIDETKIVKILEEADQDFKNAQDHFSVVGYDQQEQKVIHY